jgi:hypothetical protein
VSQDERELVYCPVCGAVVSEAKLSWVDVEIGEWEAVDIEPPAGCGPAYIRAVKTRCLGCESCLGQTVN